jgi:chemotaxis protein MotB
MPKPKQTDIPAADADEGADTPAPAPAPHSTRKPVAYRYRRDELFANETSFHEDDDSLGDHWSIPWSDLMMVMFVLFAALLAANMMQPDIEIRYKTQPLPEIRHIDRDRVVNAEVPSPQPSFESLMRINVFDRSQEAIRETQLQNIDIALLADQSVKVSVQGPMFFERGKADLRSEVIDFLDRLALVIAQTPYQVHVVGHTDDNPIQTTLFPSNWELSLVRASRVARYLIESGAIDPRRFVVMGRGQYDPAYPNEGDANRALNRRVEIIITRHLADEKVNEDA